jgi:hypothetical protein
VKVWLRRLVAGGAVSVTLDELADHLRQSFNIRVVVLLTVRKSLDLFGEGLHCLGQFDTVFRDSLNRRFGALQPIVHQHLRSQQVAKAVTKLLQGRFNLVKPLIGIGWGVHVALLYAPWEHA